MADRRNKTTRDMVISMAVVVGALLLIVGAYGGFSFSPGGPSEDTPPPVTDVIVGFTRAGPALDFESVVPRDLPAEWVANSFVLKTAANYGADVIPVARGGWLTGNGNYIALFESPATPADVLGQEIAPNLSSSVAVPAAGVSWDVYPGVRNEVAWVRVADGATIIITGSASEADFNILAKAVTKG